MFQVLFKYPAAVFSKGELVLLGGWPRWILVLLLFAAAAGLALLIRSRLRRGRSELTSAQATVIWLLESALAALLLLLLWRPAMSVAELKPQQNIIAVLVDDSRSMSISEDRVTREVKAIQALRSGPLAALQQKFQTRLYRLDGRVTRISNLAELQASAPATRIGDGLKQLIEETSDLPLGAVVLLSDGSDNTGGIDRETMAALRERHIPVHTVGFGREQMAHDVEIEDVEVESRALAESRLAVTVSFRQRGYAGRTSILRISDRGKTVGSREVTFGRDGDLQTASLLFDAGDAGAKTFQFSIDSLPGEANPSNNSLARLVNVESGRRRVLYMEGEPRWEYKFIRRAVEDDPMLHLVSMVRTTENNIYRQGIDDPTELADGFPSQSEDLFRYEGLIIGSVEASYFTPEQQGLIKRFVNRRGGGLLLLGGRFSLADGGWSASEMAGLLPVVLPDRKNTFHRDPASVDLTAAGAESIICRLVDDQDVNVERWKKLPYLMNYQDPGTPKPGAVVLATMNTRGGKMPFLITENYGLGRTAVLASGGTWRWKMALPLQDQSHATFWQQLLRWLVTDTPGRITASVASPMLFDDGSVQLSTLVRDKDYLPESDARVEARITGPGGTSAAVELTLDPTTPGLYRAAWTADKAGLYHAQVVAREGNHEVGQDAVSFQRVDGVAENFHTEQNRELLQKLASETGGRYWRPKDLSGLASEIPYSEAGITVRQTEELWDMPVVFLLIVALRSAEWLLRRRWGFV
jgi:uncharacterized membrane protein